MTAINLSFSQFSYPKTHETPVKCAWGSCGLFAFSQNKVITVYYDDIRGLTPIIMFSPFDEEISALEWHNVTYSAGVGLPILVIGTVRGQVAIFDCRARSIVSSVVFDNNSIGSLKW